MEEMKINRAESHDDGNMRGMLSARLKEVKDNIAPDYNIPASLWDRMVSALEKGSPASGGAFTAEDLKTFDDETKSRLGNFLAEATRGIVPGSSQQMFDSRGTFISHGEKDDLREKVQKERAEE